MRKIVSLFLALTVFAAIAVGCDASEAQKDNRATLQVGETLQGNQPTPTDLTHSLERFNLVRRAYWVNGQREKAMSLTVPIPRPLGYIVLVTDSGSVMGRFIVDGKVSSLQNYLTPISENYGGESYNKWLPDTDGTFGDNPAGIFFFTADGKYIEWNGKFLFSDIPFEVADPILKIGG